MLSYILNRLQKVQGKSESYVRRRAAFRRSLIAESLEDRRLLTIFAPEVLYSSGGAFPYNLAVADFNVDGKTDVASANISGQSVGVLSNLGAGTFSTSSLASSGPGFFNVATGDFNNDTFPDVAATTFGSVGVFLGDGNGGFSSPIYTNASAYPIAAGELDSDGNLDLIVATNSGGPGIQFLKGLGNGQFQNMGVLPNSNLYPFHDLALQDVNSDGKLDAVGATMNADGVYVALGDGAGGFTFKGHFLSAVNSGSRHIALGDLNGDGQVDVVTADQNIGSVSVLLGDGTGGFSLSGSFSSGSNGPSSVGIADFDGDSHADVVVSNRNSNVVGVLLGNGAGSLGPVITFTSAGNGAKDLIVADFNNDSQPDLAVAYSSTNHVGIFLNVSNTPPVLSNVALTPSSIVEGSAATLTGTVTDQQGGPFSMLVDWGEGAPQSYTLPANSSSFSISHTYLDDNPTGTSSDTYQVQILSLTDPQGATAQLHTGSSISASLIGDISNSDFNNATSAPFGLVTTGEFTLTNAGIAHSHSGSVDVFVDLFDPGTNTWTQVFHASVAGSLSFNNQTLVFPVQAFDRIRFRSSPGQNQTFHGWGGSVDLVLPNNSTRSVTVANEAPTVSDLSASPILENGTTILSGKIADVGVQDTFTVEIDWDNDGTFDETHLNVSAGLFSYSHQYLDDEPPATPVDNLQINVKVTDDDTGSVVDGTTVEISNVAPTLSGLAITSPINENDFAALTGNIIDPGTQDTFTLTVDWGDGSPLESFTYPAGTSSFSETHQYLDDNPSGTSSDVYQLSLTISDDDGGSNSYTGVNPTLFDNGLAQDNQTSGYFSSQLQNWRVYDDFTLSNLETISSVFFQQGITPGGTLAAFEFAVYADNAGLPGAQVYSTTLNVGDYLATPNSLNSFPFGQFYDIEFDLPATLTLAAGTYYTSFYGLGITDFRTPNVGTGNSFFQQPGNSFFASRPGDTPFKLLGPTAPKITVNNVAPVIQLDPVAMINENEAATLTGQFSDPGLLDTHVVNVDWDDPNTPVNSTFALPATNALTIGATFNSVSDAGILTVTGLDLVNGTVSFSIQHVYLDDGIAPGNATSSDISTITVTVTDDDLGGLSTELVTNGDFETGDLTGWTLFNAGNGTWTINDGTFDPPGPSSALPPIAGNFDVVSNQGGPGVHILSEPIVVPVGISSATLSWSDRIRNWASDFSDPNQEWRVLILDSVGGLIQEVFSTEPGDALQQVGPNNRSFDLTSLLQSLAGQTIHLSFQQEDNLDFFNVSLDDVSLQVATSVSAEVLVKNVAPTITHVTSGAEECGTAHEDDPITLDLEFDDIGLLDVHTVTVDWGDGQVQSIVLPTGDRTLSVDHDYVTGGIYTITVTLSDDDFGAASTSVLAVVSGVGLHDGVLQIIGTSAADHVSLNQTGNGTLKVHADFLSEGTRNFDLSDVDSILAILCDGDDHMTISSKITLDAVIDGGNGDDHLNGGGGSNLILGGGGDDHINGGSTRDILIGGFGADRIVGNPGRDLISGGRLTHNVTGSEDTVANLADLTVLQAKYKSASEAQLDAWLAGTDDFFDDLALSIVDDDGEADKLTGSSGEDWVLRFANDIWTDLKSNGKGKK